MRDMAYHVLVIEDNDMNANVLRENMTYAGYSFSHAINGAAGVAVAAEELPDIILMDVNLPLLDGLSATRLLKKHNLLQGIPVIALTAKAMAGDRENCLAAGCNDYVSKPVNMDVLLDKMKLLLEKRPPAFVDMIRRMRITAARHKSAAQPADTPATPDAANPRAADKLANLILTMERLEAELALSRARATALDDAIAERDHKIAALAQERDAAKAEMKRESARAMRLTAELDALWVNPDGPAPRDSERPSPERRSIPPQSNPSQAAPSATARRSTDEDLIEESARNRKLLHRLKAAQDKLNELQQQNTRAPSPPTAQATPSPQHDLLQKVFLQLQMSVASAAAEAKRAAEGN